MRIFTWKKYSGKESCCCQAQAILKRNNFFHFFAWFPSVSFPFPQLSYRYSIIFSWLSIEKNAYIDILDSWILYGFSCLYVHKEYISKVSSTFFSLTSIEFFIKQKKKNKIKSIITGYKHLLYSLDNNKRKTKKYIIHFG